MMTRDSFENDYLKQLDYCINKYSDQIKILKGLEVEFIPSKDYYYQYLFTKIEYLNLGVHYFFKNGEIVNTYGYLSEDDLDWYAKTIEEALETNYFSCLVHPDLFLYRINTFTKFHEIIARRIIEACIKNDVYLEVNCNGRDKYPRKEFWEIVKEYQTLIPFEYPYIKFNDDIYMFIKDSVVGSGSTAVTVYTSYYINFNTGKTFSFSGDVREYYYCNILQDNSIVLLQYKNSMFTGEGLYIIYNDTIYTSTENYMRGDTNE
jgi:hypothetical protein